MRKEIKLGGLKKASPTCPDEPFTQKELDHIAQFTEIVLRSENGSPIHEAVKQMLYEGHKQYPQTIKMFSNEQEQLKYETKITKGALYPEDLFLSPVGNPVAVVKGWPGWKWQDWDKYEEKYPEGLDYTSEWHLCNCTFFIAAEIHQMDQRLLIKFDSYSHKHLAILKILRDGAPLIVCPKFSPEVIIKRKKAMMIKAADTRLLYMVEAIEKRNEITEKFLRMS